MENEMISFVNSATNPDKELSILEDQYDIESFKAVFHNKQNSADIIISKAAKIAFAKGVADNVKDGLQRKVKYVVDNSDAIHEAVKKGLIKFDIGKDGKIFAQLRDANNHFGKKLPIHKELSAKGINVAEMANALQMKAIEEQLSQIIDVLAEIGTDVSRVLEGQQNDRIGLFYSGLNLYLEAKNIQDSMFSKYISAQSLKALSDANAQMVQSIQSDVRYLLTKEYKKSKGKQEEFIQERMLDINKSFEIIYRSFMLKAVIYYEQGEMPAMLTALDEYGKFLQRVIIPNAMQLSEHDINDVYLQDGIWEKRAASFLQTEELKKELSEKKVYYLEIKEN